MDYFGRFRTKEIAISYATDRARNGISEQRSQMPFIILLAIVNIIVTYCTKKTLDHKGGLLLIWNMVNFALIVSTYLVSLKYQNAKNYLLFDFLYASRQVSSIILAFYGLNSSINNLILFSIKFLVCSVLVMNIIISTGFRIAYFLGCMTFIFWEIRHIKFSIWHVQNGTETFILVMMCLLKELADRRVFCQKYQEVKNGDTLKFILNEVPESIVILNKKLEEKFVNNYVYKIFEKDSSTAILEIFKKITTISVQGSFNESSIQNRQTGSLKKFSSETSLYTLCTTNCFDTQELFSYLTNKHKIKNSEILLLEGKYQKDTNSQSTIEIKVSSATFLEEECIIFILRDTTQRDTIVQLKGDNAYKDSLLASVSHELRTPLNGTLNFVEASIHDEETPKLLKEKYLAPALSSGKILQHIINDFLDYSQIRLGKLRLVYTEDNLRKTCKQCLSLLKLQCEKKGIDLRLVYNSDVPEEFYTDHNRLSQIILNLVNNALKFTSQGHIEVTVEKMESAVKISIADTGIGITPEDQQKLFKEFSKVDLGKDMHINSTGVGLGLAISNSLVKILGPNDNSGITLASTPEIGSIFSFLIIQKDSEGNERHSLVRRKMTENFDSSEDMNELLDKRQIYNAAERFRCVSPSRQSKFKAPFVHNRLSHSTSITGANLEKFQQLFRPPNQASTKQSTLSTSQDSSRKVSNLIHQHTVCACPKILIIDDDSFNLIVLENLCKNLNLKTDSAFNGKEAVAKVLQREDNKCGASCKQYEIILMDCNMPVMNGMEATKTIRNHEFKNIKIVGCTGYSDEVILKECLECGMNGTLMKPVDKEKLREIIFKYL